jgi:hypothetical protein
MTDKHEFRFVVEGVELAPEQVEAIENAVREAGLLAMGRASIDQAGYVAVEPRKVFDRIKWRGYWILAGELARESVHETAQQYQRSFK